MSRLKDSIDMIIEREQKIKDLKDAITPIEMEILLLVNGLSNIEPTKEILDEIDQLIEADIFNKKFNISAKFEILRLILMGYENGIIEKQPRSFNGVSKINTFAYKQFTDSDITKIKRMINHNMKDVITMLEKRGPSSLKKRNILAGILCLKWGYSRDKLAKILSVKRKRIDEIIEYDMIELYIRIAQMKGV